MSLVFSNKYSKFQLIIIGEMCFVIITDTVTVTKVETPENAAVQNPCKRIYKLIGHTQWEGL